MATTKRNKEKPLNKRTVSRLVGCGWLSRCNNVRPRDRDLLSRLEDLEQLTRWLEEEFTLELPRKHLESVAAVKKFCDGLLDGSHHPWRRGLKASHACLRTRAATASSLFLFRKTLPQTKSSRREVETALREYEAKMVTPQPPPSQEVLDFATHLLESEFPIGWDKKKWHRHVDSFTLPVKACLENGAGEGGSRNLATAEGREELWRGEFVSKLEAKFLDFVSDDETGANVELCNDTKLAQIWTGGKNRIVSIFSAERSFLTPLHKTIYDHISKKEWLLRGEAEPGRFSEFTAVKGEVYVSGDYESASDNLNIHLSEHILRVLASRSRSIPKRVWANALTALRARFVGSGEYQARGQLMGSLLSFPLLCLTNYIGFKFFVPRDVPVKINGDDIVFRSTRQEARTWMDGVSAMGLTLSIGKTLVTPTLFSLNSNFFLGRHRDGITQVAHIRSSCVFLKGDCAPSLQGRIVRSVVGFSEKTKSKIHAFTLRRNAAHVWASQRSLLRGLQVPVSVRSIKAAGLISREAYYLSQTFEPAPVAPRNRWQDWRMPTGWERVWSEKEGAEDDVGFTSELVRSCWEAPVRFADISYEAYMEALRDRTSTYVPYFSRKLFKRLYAVEDYNSFRDRLPDGLARFRPKEREGEKEGKWVWRRKSRVAGVAFTSAGFAKPE